MDKPTENKTSDGLPAPPAAKKYTPPIDQPTGDLIPEGTVYLRLLLVLLNLDAGKVVEVCLSSSLRSSFKWLGSVRDGRLTPGRRSCHGDCSAVREPEQTDDGPARCQDLLLPGQVVRAPRPSLRASVVSLIASDSPAGLPGCVADAQPLPRYSPDRVVA